MMADVQFAAHHQSAAPRHSHREQRVLGAIGGEPFVKPDIFNSLAAIDHAEARKP